MKREQLEEYQYIIEEIKSIERRIKNVERQIDEVNEQGLVVDKVMGGEGGIQSFRIEGFPYKRYNELRQKLHTLRQRLLDAKIELINIGNEIEDWVDTLDGRDKIVFKMVFLEGKTQQQVANRLHLDQSRISRIIQKNIENNKNA